MSETHIFMHSREQRFTTISCRILPVNLDGIEGFSTGDDGSRGPCRVMDHRWYPTPIMPTP